MDSFIRTPLSCSREIAEIIAGKTWNPVAMSGYARRPLLLLLRLDREPHKSGPRQLSTSDGSGRDPHRHNDQNIAEGNSASNLHDLLTDLPNRMAFIGMATERLRGGEQGSKPFRSAYLDLDDFKDINETLGHSWAMSSSRQWRNDSLALCVRDDRIARRRRGRVCLYS